MSEDAGGRADEVGTARVMGNERDDNDGGVGQGNLAGDGRPTGEGGALQAEEQEDTPEEALDAGALAEFVLRPGGWETGAVFEVFGVEGDDGGGTNDGVDPGDERRPPVGGVEADDAGAEGVEGDSSGEQGLSKMTRCRSAAVTVSTKRVSQHGAPARAARFHCCEGQGTQGAPSGRAGRPHANASAGQARSQSDIARGERRQSVRSSASRSSDSSV